MQISVVDMDPAITELVIDIDGQVLRYAHGPDRPLKVTWPGPRNGSMAEITASPRIRQDTSTLLTGGPWALFHLLDAGMVQETAVRGRQLVEYDFDGRRVVLEITAGRDFNPVSRSCCRTSVVRRGRCNAPASGGISPGDVRQAAGPARLCALAGGR